MALPSETVDKIQAEYKRWRDQYPALYRFFLTTFLPVEPPAPPVVIINGDTCKQCGGTGYHRGRPGAVTIFICTACGGMGTIHK